MTTPAEMNLPPSLSFRIGRYSLTVPSKLWYIESSLPQNLASGSGGVGIGFTMSIFIAELAFTDQAKYLLMAKPGFLVASLLAS